MLHSVTFVFILPVSSMAWTLAGGQKRWVQARHSRGCMREILAAASTAERVAVLPDDEFERACASHRTILALKKDAPNTFASPPADDTIFSEDIKLTNDLGLQVVQGRTAYLEAFNVVRQAISAPLVPIEVTKLIQCRCTPVERGVLVQWRVPIRIGSGSGGVTVELSGLSTYRLNSRGQLSDHALSDLRVNERRLPSSTLGAWLSLLQARGDVSSPASALLLLMDTMKAARLEQSAATQEAKDAAAAASVASASAASAARGPLDAPLPGTDAWSAYERRHRVLVELSKGFEVLLESEPPLGAYAQGVVLVAEGGEVLISTLTQYQQLLATLRNLHRALIASPLLAHSFKFDFVRRNADGKATGFSEDEAEVRVAWTYALKGVGPLEGQQVTSLQATSAFRLGTAGDGSGSYEVVRHALIGLQLNGRPALPKTLLEQLRRVQSDSPELVRFLSSTLLAVSGSAFLPSAGGAFGSATGNARRAEAAGGRGAVAGVGSSAVAGVGSSAGAVLTPATAPATFATGYVRLLKALHAQLPLLLSEPLELDEIAISTVEVRGMLREPLVLGRPALASTLKGLRSIASTMLAERAMSVPPDGLEWRLEVEPSLGLLIRWSLSFEWGGAQSGRMAPRVAVPGKVEGEVLLGLDKEDARVREVWVRRIALNGRSVLPDRVSAWLSGKGSGSDLMDFVRSVLGGI
jgi:hypothetical protein